MCADVERPVSVIYVYKSIVCHSWSTPWTRHWPTPFPLHHTYLSYYSYIHLFRQSNHIFKGMDPKSRHFYTYYIVFSSHYFETCWSFTEFLSNKLNYVEKEPGG